MSHHFPETFQFYFEQNLVLENEWVRLSPLETEHLDLLKHFAEQHPEIWTYSLMSISNPSEMGRYINSAVQKRKEAKEYAFVVFDKVKNQYAGSTRFYDFDFSHANVTIGYTWYGPEFQRTHVNTNCKKLLLEYAFLKMGARRVEFRADVNNIKSITAMKRIGCKEEGVLRNHLFLPDGSRRSSIILSILREEWEAFNFSSF